MKSINLILGNHNHQPVGNFDFVIENAYNRAYQPFLKILSEYPDIKFSFHYTGALLKWIEANHYEHIEAIKKLVSNGQVEMQGGGFYEPILPSISDRDKDAQLLKLNQYIKKHFGVLPKGAWLAERVWEPNLITHFDNANLEYIILDDNHFSRMGLKEDDMYGYFITDNNDKKLNIFPISKPLRYFIPFKQVDETIEYLRSIATEEGDRVVVLEDDGEKYGDWPDTYKWVYEDGWLKRFFAALDKEKSWLKTTTYSEYMSQYPPLRKVYIPTGSYEEMTTWVLPASTQVNFHDSLKELKNNNDEKYLPFMAGGFWRNYFAKYNESNRMNKRMIFTSNMVHNMPEGSNKEKALDYVLQSQCNCPYWHGTFGGIYLNSLRHATYRNIIMATELAEKEILKTEKFILEKKDIDIDGYDDIYVSTKNNSLIFNSISGSISEFSLKKNNPINLVDNLKRIEEAYHIEALRNKNVAETNNEHVSIHDIVKMLPEDIEPYLVFDKNEKILCVDHFLEKEVNALDFSLMKYNDIANFYDKHYLIKKYKKNDDNVEVVFEYEGNVSNNKVKIKKSYKVYIDNRFTLDVEIENLSDSDLSFVYALENNLTLLAGYEDDRYYIAGENSEKISNRLDCFGEYSGNIIGMVDEAYIKVNVFMKSITDCKFLYMPNFAISDAVSKLEMNYQNSTLVSLIDTHIKPKNKVKYVFEMYVKEL